MRRGEGIIFGMWIVPASKARLLVLAHFLWYHFYENVVYNHIQLQL